MLGIKKLFENAYKTMTDRNWDTIYVMVDVHGTIMQNNYAGMAHSFYTCAIQALQLLSKRSDIVLVLYTSCYPDDIKTYVELFASHGINFKYANENPDVKNTKTGCFDTKAYFSILLDDKAGFDPYMDWETIIEYYNERG
jgi:hypothetical protein